MKIPVLLMALTLIVLTWPGMASISSAEKSVAPAETVKVPAATQFSSRYTSLIGCGSGMTKEEEKEAEEHGSDIPTSCEGYGGYHIYISYSACSSDFRAEMGEESIRLATQAVDWKQKTVEWRMANGKPFAVIMRAYEYRGDEQCADAGKITGEFIVVKGLKGYEHIDARVNVKRTPNPNARAREIADKGYAKH